MANYRIIANYHPAVPVYLRTRIWARQGGRLIYRPGNTTKAFATDSFGFRHSTFEGRVYKVDERISEGKCSAVLGSSHAFGFGLPGNEHTFASRFALKFGHPTLNVSYPEANTADLYNAAATHLDWSKLDRIVLFPGGSFTRFCYTGICDDQEGPPPIHGSAPVSVDPSKADQPDVLERLIDYQVTWISAISRLCGEHGVHFFVVDEATFFEKEPPTGAEIDAQLGVSQQPEGQVRFDRHKSHIGPYRQHLFPLLEKEGITVLDFGPVENITFIDEFHYDAPSIERIVDRLFDQMDLG